MNSKRKGNTFERKIANKLKAWSRENFHRTPLSGGLHWENDIRVISDIVPPLNIGWPFSIECKNVMYDWGFDKIDNGISLFWKHWKQATDDAEIEQLIPLLIFTKNRSKDFIAIKECDLLKLMSFAGKEIDNYIVIKNSLYENKIIIINFDNFLEIFKFKEIINCFEK